MYKCFLENLTYPVPKNFPVLIIIGLTCKRLTRVDATEKEAPSNDATNNTKTDTI